MDNTFLKLAGIVLMIATIGLGSCQALLTEQGLYENPMGDDPETGQGPVDGSGGEG